MITNAPDAASRDAGRRQKQYLILMGIRVVCILGAFLIPGWIKWPVIAAAAILPGVAVMLANQPNQKKLLAGRDAPPEDPEPRTAISDGHHVVLHGEVDDEPIDRPRPRR